MNTTTRISTAVGGFRHGKPAAVGLQADQGLAASGSARVAKGRRRARLGRPNRWPMDRTVVKD